MPVPFPQNTPAPFAERAVPGLMIDYEVHPGGLWAGDYWIVEYEPLRKEPELSLAVAMHRGFLHRTKEVWLVRGDAKACSPGFRRACVLLTTILSLTL